MTLVQPPDELRRVYPNHAGPMESPFTVTLIQPPTWSTIVAACTGIERSMLIQGFDLVSLHGGTNAAGLATITFEVETSTKPTLTDRERALFKDGPDA